MPVLKVMPPLTCGGCLLAADRRLKISYVVSAAYTILTGTKDYFNLISGNVGSW
jgi:hypothetical protein